MDDTIPQETPKKQCGKCKRFLPATTDFFYPVKNRPSGLMYQCKECRSEYMSARYTKQHPEAGKSLRTDVKKVCTTCNEPKVLTSENFKPIGHGFYNECRECMKGKDIKKVSGSQPKQYVLLPDTKTCTKCGETKPLNESNFPTRSRSIDGFFNICRECTYKQDTERAHKRHQDTPPIFREDVLKECSRCHNQYPTTPQYFHLNKRKPDGLDIECKMCKKIRSKEYNLNHADERQQHGFNYREANREHIREQGRAYVRARNAEHNARFRKRYNQLKQNGGTLTTKDIMKQYDEQQGNCYWCKDTLDQYHVDHLVPVSLGGPDTPENIVLACPFCNRSRGNKTVEEWLPYLEKFILSRKEKDA